MFLYVLACIATILVIILLIQYVFGSEEQQLNCVPPFTCIIPNETAPTYTPEQIAQLNEWFGPKEQQ